MTNSKVPCWLVDKGSVVLSVYIGNGVVQLCLETADTFALWLALLEMIHVLLQRLIQRDCVQAFTPVWYITICYIPKLYGVYPYEIYIHMYAYHIVHTYKHASCRFST